MNNFERITASPEALGDFLGALPILSGPWDDDFHRVFCDSCDAENCDAENCAHQAERNSPMGAWKPACLGISTVPLRALRVKQWSLCWIWLGFAFLPVLPARLEAENRAMY